jgi:hypothetical protein
MEKLDKERYLKRVIVVCWIALAICFGIKLFGGNLFEIMCSNENFIKVCNYADNNLWAYFLINGIYCYVCMYFHTLAMIGKWKYNNSQIIILSITIICGLFVKSIHPIASFAYDLWQGILMPFVFSWNNKKRIFYILIGNILLIVFQLVSLFVKNIGISIITNNGTLTTVIFGIDVFLMVLLYYFYSNILIKNKGEK